MVEITEADRGALRRYMVERAQIAFNGTTGPHADLLLETLARHRLAARREALEEAAGVAKEHGLAAVRMMLASGLPGGTKTQRTKSAAFADGYGVAAGDIGDAIRNLKGQGDDQPDA